MVLRGEAPLVNPSAPAWADLPRRRAEPNRRDRLPPDASRSHAVRRPTRLRTGGARPGGGPATSRCAVGRRRAGRPGGPPPRAGGWRAGEGLRRLPREAGGTPPLDTLGRRGARGDEGGGDAPASLRRERSHLADE